MAVSIVATENGVTHHTEDFVDEEEARVYLGTVKEYLDRLIDTNASFGGKTTDVRIDYTEDGRLDAVEFDSVNYEGVVVRYQVQGV